MSEKFQFLSLRRRNTVSLESSFGKSIGGMRNKGERDRGAGIREA